MEDGADAAQVRVARAEHDRHAKLAGLGDEAIAGCFVEPGIVAGHGVEQADTAHAALGHPVGQAVDGVGLGDVHAADGGEAAGVGPRHVGGVGVVVAVGVGGLDEHGAVDASLVHERDEVLAGEGQPLEAAGYPLPLDGIGLVVPRGDVDVGIDDHRG